LVGKMQAEKEKRELYRDRKVQMLLSKFLSGEIETLEPAYSPDVGYSYPLVENIVGDASQAEAFLNKLYKAGVLEKELYDRSFSVQTATLQTSPPATAVLSASHLTSKKALWLNTLNADTWT
jgi:hypothetical protein